MNRSVTLLKLEQIAAKNHLMNIINMNSINNNFLEKKRYFNIIKDIINTDNNNEIKVLKNKKPVYINRCLLDSYSTSRSIKKFKKTKFDVRSKTSSKYRGVSKNGNQWQALIMINNKKYYIGSYPYENIAARIYDILSIQNRGIKARTNFKYNHIQLKNIFESKINIKSDNISDIIEHFIN